MDKGLKIVCSIAAIASFMLIALYFCFFHYGFSKDSTSWSNFGGYINGILSPILTMVNIYVFIKLTTTISEIENNRANDAIKQNERHFKENLEQEKAQFDKQLEQAKMQFEKQLEHEKQLLYLQFRKQEFNTFCQNVNEALSLYPREEVAKKLERISSYLDSFISSSLKLFMINDLGETERKIQKLKMNINIISASFMFGESYDEKIYENIMDLKDSIIKTLQESTFNNSTI